MGDREPSTRLLESFLVLYGGFRDGETQAAVDPVPISWHHIRGASLWGGRPRIQFNALDNQSEPAADALSQRRLFTKMALRLPRNDRKAGSRDARCGKGCLRREPNE
jgi:hypothetical protein